MKQTKKNLTNLNVESLYIADKFGIENITFKYDLNSGLVVSGIKYPICEFTVLFNKPYVIDSGVTMIEIKSKYNNYSATHEINFNESGVKEGDISVISSSDPYAGIVIAPKGKSTSVTATMDNGSTWSTKITS